MGAQSAGIGGGGGGTKPLKRLISLALSDIFGFGNSLAVLWLPWAALVWAFIIASLALALGEREAQCTKRGGWRAARAQGWTVRSDAIPGRASSGDFTAVVICARRGQELETARGGVTLVIIVRHLQNALTSLRGR